MLRHIAKILAGLSILIFGISGAEAGKAGSEFIVSKTALNSAIAPLPNGGFVIVWRGDDPNYTISAQRYDKNGVKIGGVLVVAPTSREKAKPAVAPLLDGGFAVTWDATDVSGLGAFVQRFTATGTKGTEGKVRANTFTTGDQFEPTIAGLKNGTYVVLWTSNGQGGSSSAVYGQRFTKLGAKVGAEFRVDTTLPGSFHLAPSVSPLTGGGFVAVYRGQNGTYARRFNASAGGIGDDVQVNPGNEGLLQHPVVAGLKDGGFVVIREVSDTTRDVYGQRYNVSGVKVGPANFLVNKTKAGEQFDPAVTGLSNGGFVVVFADGTSTHSALGRLYNSSGTPGAANFKANTSVVPIDASPSVGPLLTGAFVAAWQGSATTGVFIVRAQRFDGL